MTPVPPWRSSPLVVFRVLCLVARRGDPSVLYDAWVVGAVFLGCCVSSLSIDLMKRVWVTKPLSLSMSSASRKNQTIASDVGMVC